MHILILNNNDSFTYNIRQYILEAGAEVTVINSDVFKPEQAEEFDGIVFSPGPGLPSDFPVMAEVLRRYSGTKKILGVCLGLQAIAEFYGGVLYNLPEIYHGREITVTVTAEDVVFNGVVPEFSAGVYHSWAVRPESLPPDVQITAVGPGGVVQAIKHKTLNVRAFQFHPESVLTSSGRLLIKNWLFSC